MSPDGELYVVDCGSKIVQVVVAPASAALTALIVTSHLVNVWHADRQYLVIGPGGDGCLVEQLQLV